MRNAFIEQLVMRAKDTPHVYLLTADLGFSCIEQFANLYPNQFLNVGVAEQNMIGIAAGLALSGKIVFVYSINNFATLRCLEQIRNDICYHKANVKIVSVGAGFAYGQQGYTHYGIEDLAIMRALPHMKVYSPADALEVSAIIDDCFENHGPQYIRLGKTKESILHKDSFTYATMMPLLQNNSRTTVLATGAITACVQKYLLAEEIQYDLWSVPLIKPLDHSLLLKVLQNRDRIFTVEEHQLDGGFGSAILEGCEKLLQDNAITKMPNLFRIGINNTIPHDIGTQEYMRNYIDLSMLKRAQ